MAWHFFITISYFCHNRDYTKEEVRDIAKRKGLPVAEKPDSQEICFVLDKDYAGFIQKQGFGVLACKYSSINLLITFS